MIVFKKGNIFNAETRVIAHQVNCQGVMRSGLAKQVRDKYPQVYDDYVDFINYFDDKKQMLGLCLFTDAESDRTIANLFGKLNSGSGDGLDETMLRQSFQDLKTQMKMLKFKSVAIPYKIGSSLGGDNWETILGILKEVFADDDILCEIWDLG